jgi:phosphatidylserine/phosphatidylglycerophosphate/cardiolipin synthase-like enzyme
LLVQAYSLTSVPIIQAIARAKERRVTVGVILDRANEQKRYTAATYLANHCIAPLIDDRVTIAHNKVMVIDGRDVITGSFNFTAAAQQRNAENVLLIKDDATVAAAYAANWQRRAAAARPQASHRTRQGAAINLEGPGGLRDYFRCPACAKAGAAGVDQRPAARRRSWKAAISSWRGRGAPPQGFAPKQKITL